MPHVIDKSSNVAYRVLEVGALKPDNYASCSSWMDVTPIDLHSRHPDILEQNFLQLDEEENKEKWDLISLSLVVNFVPEPKDRGILVNITTVIGLTEYHRNQVECFEWHMQCYGQTNTSFSQYVHRTYLPCSSLTLTIPHLCLCSFHYRAS